MGGAFGLPAPNLYAASYAFLAPYIAPPATRAPAANLPTGPNLLKALAAGVAAFLKLLIGYFLSNFFIHLGIPPFFVVSFIL